MEIKICNKIFNKIGQIVEYYNSTSEKKIVRMNVR